MITIDEKMLKEFRAEFKTAVLGLEKNMALELKLERLRMPKTTSA